MGFFNKLFGKEKKDIEIDGIPDVDKTVTTNDVSEIQQEASDGESSSVECDDRKTGDTSETKENVTKTEASEKEEKVTSILEMFPVKKQSVTPQRSSEICHRFINNALNMGEELKTSDIVTLNYSELCVLYNNMQMMELKMEPKHKAIAGVVINNNKKIVRSRLITMLKKQTLYTLYTAMNKLPFVRDGAFYIFTHKQLAEEQLKKTQVKHLGIKEIPEEQLEEHFDVFYVAGYKDVIIDVGTKISFSELYIPKDKSVYGIINPTACGKMIFFNQLVTSYTDKANAENRSVTAEENIQINRVLIDITETLIRSEALLLPAEKTENGKILIKNIVVKGPDGKKWVAMFTDQIAINMFFKKNQPAVKFRNPVLEQFKVIKNDAEIEGIIINPARESFRIPSKLLATRQVYKKEDNSGSEDDKQIS